MSFLEAKKRPLYIFLFLSCLFLIRYALVGQAVYGDGIYYYSYTKSLIKDKDLHFANELGHHWSPSNNNTLIEDLPDNIIQRTGTNMVPNKYPIGAPIVWLPVFSLTDLFAHTLHQLNPNFPNNGYSDIYQISIGLFNVGLITWGIMLLVKFWNQFFSLKTIWLATAIVLLATNLIYYGAFDVINSHPLSFLLSMLLLDQWWKLSYQKRWQSWFKLGIITGILAMTRTQHLIFPILICLESIFKLGIKQSKNILIMLASAIITFSPQLLVWYYLYGKIISPYLLTNEGFNFFKPHLIELFFNPQAGLLIWTPVYGLAIFGLIKYHQKNPVLSKICLLVFVSQVYLISSWSGWSQGESFGIRMLINTLPFLTGGLAFLLEKWQTKISRNLIYSFIFFLISYNFLSIAYFQFFWQSPTFDKGIITQEQRWLKFKQLISR